MHLPPAFRSRPRAIQIALVGLAPLFGALTGWMLGVNEIAYLVLVLPIGILGGFFAGLEHRRPRDGALRGLVGGALFGGFILLVHELSGLEAEAQLPHPPILLMVFTTVIGSGLGAWGGRIREKREGAPAEPAEPAAPAPG